MRMYEHTQPYSHTSLNQSRVSAVHPHIRILPQAFCSVSIWQLQFIRMHMHNSGRQQPIVSIRFN